MTTSQRDFLIGIDIGGSLIKCALFTQDGIQVARAAVRLPISQPKIGYTERDAKDIWQGCCNAIRTTLETANVDAQCVRGVAACGYGGGMGLIDRDGEQIYPFIVSTDTRAEILVEKFQADGTTRRLRDLTLQELWAGQPAALLPWFKQRLPDIPAKADCLLSIKDFIRYKLTGVSLWDLTDASCSNLLNIRTMSVDDEILKLLGIQEYKRLFPEIRLPHQQGGFVTKRAASETGLPSGIPVALGLYDVNACCAASGVIDEETLCLITGTWSVNEYLTKQIEDAKGKSGATLAFLPGHYMIEESSPTSASNLDWFLRQHYAKLFKHLAPKELYRHCDRIVAALDPADSAVLFVPYLYASASTPGAKGAFFNLSSRDGMEQMLLSVYEGVLFSSLYHIERLTGGGEIKKKIRLTGGVAHAPVWTQMFADILQAPITAMNTAEPGALGAAMCAGIACGMFRDFPDAVRHMVAEGREYLPRPAAIAIYRKKYILFKKALEALYCFHGSVYCK